MCEVLNNSY